MPDCIYDGLKMLVWNASSVAYHISLPAYIFDTTIFETSNSFFQLSNNATSPDSVTQ